MSPDHDSRKAQRSTVRGYTCMACKRYNREKEPCDVCVSYSMQGQYSVDTGTVVLSSNSSQANNTHTTHTAYTHHGDVPL